jgi:hypothetical protein
LVIIDVVEQRGVEYKSGQYFYRDPDIMQELAKDRYLVQNSGWEITWVFEVEEGVSEPLVQELRSSGITVIVNGEVQ